MPINQSEKSFGTAPVFFTAISTILGAILFLRFGYAVGILGLIANITLTIAISDYDTPSSELIFWGGMFILSAISAIAGSRLGKRKTIQST